MNREPLAFEILTVNVGARPMKSIPFTVASRTRPLSLVISKVATRPIPNGFVALTSEPPTYNAPSTLAAFSESNVSALVTLALVYLAASYL